jgi:hypothetical protein
VVDAARVCAAAGDLALGQRLLEGLEPVMTRQRHSVVTAHAILAEARGALGEAEALYEEAAAAWGDYGHVFEHAQALLGLGRCRLSLGRAGGTASLTAAREVFTRLGAQPLVAEAEELLGKALPTTS